MENVFSKLGALCNKRVSKKSFHDVMGQLWMFKDFSYYVLQIVVSCFIVIFALRLSVLLLSHLTGNEYSIIPNLCIIFKKRELIIG